MFHLRCAVRHVYVPSLFVANVGLTLVLKIEVTFVLDDTQFHAEALHVESGKIESLTRSKDELNTTLDTSRLKQNGGEVVVADTLLLSDGAVDEL